MPRGAGIGHPAPVRMGFVVSTGSTDEGGSNERVGESVATGEGPVREKPGRYQRSPAGMVGALIVTLLVISAFVAFRALNRTDLDVKPERVDYLAQVRFAQQDAQGGTSDLVYPAGPAHRVVCHERLVLLRRRRTRRSRCRC